MKISHKILAVVVAQVVFTALVGTYAVHSTRKAMCTWVEDAARSRAASIADEIDRQIHTRLQEWKAYTRSSLVQKTLSESNDEFEVMPDVQAEIDRRDVAWRGTPKTVVSSLQRELMTNPLGRDLIARLDHYELANGEALYGEAFLTNKFGANVAVSGRLSDYRQDDEEWWQVAHRDGVDVDDIEYDESAEMNSLALGVAVADERGQFLGVLKAVLNLTDVLSLIDRRSAEYVGTEYRQIVLLTHDLQVIHVGGETASPLKNGDNYVKGISFADEVVSTQGVVFDETGRAFLSTFARSRGFDGYAGNGWQVLVRYANSEAYGEVDAAAAHVIAGTVGAAILQIVVGLLLAFSFTRRVRRVVEASQKLARGDLAVRVRVRGRDEIAHLGSQFNVMAASLTEISLTLRDQLTLTEWQRDKVEREVAERRRIEVDLRREEAIIRAVLDNAGDGIITIDERGVVLSFNSAAARMFHRTIEDAVGQHVSVLMPATDRCPHDDVACYLQECLGIVLGAPRDVEAVDADGAKFPAEIVITELLIADVRMFVGVVRDLSERKKMELDLSHAQKMESVGRLAAGIAHEINTPTQFVGDNLRFLKDAFDDLAGIVDESKRLLDSVRGGGDSKAAGEALAAQIEQRDFEYLSDEVPKAIEQGLDGLQRVASIVKAMKEFSHPSGDDKQPVDINRVVENATIVSRNEWKYAAELVTDFDPNNPVLYGYEGELGQVLLNLIVNAAHAIAEKPVGDPSDRGTITVKTRLEDDSVRVSVEDTGGGIPPEFRERVFDPFFTTKAVGKGTGQGLSIAHDVVVRRHGGAISLDTEVGRGTTFHLILPVADPAARVGNDLNEFATEEAADEASNSVRG